MTRQQAPHGPRIAWSANEVIERDSFGGVLRHIRIDAEGRVGRWLQHCGGYVTVIGDDYLPITAEPLACEADAQALLERVKALGRG